MHCDQQSLVGAEMEKIKYKNVFDSVFSAATPPARIQFSEVMQDPRLAGVQIGTRKSHLKKYINEDPRRLSLLAGMIPSPETVIALVEGELGSIVETNIVAANVRCREIVGAIVKPMVGDFVFSNLAHAYDSSNGSFTVRQEELIDFLLADFSEYLKASGNGLMSIAGSLNERLLHCALENSGLRSEVDFSVTGTDSEGDIVIHCASGARDNLGVEVKSYHARERLLRGLKDVKQPKVGVGYFLDPNEFNLTRTKTLMQANPAAIYMPSATLADVDPAARGLTTNELVAFGSSLYRPIERFATDMRGFVERGKLPPYSFAP